MSRNGSSLARRPAGFTLVELLVVIGIIALLISILLPSLNRARQAANSVDCKSRLRSIGQGVHMYAANWKSTLPPSNTLAKFNSQTATRTKFFANIVSETLGEPEFEISRLFHDKDTIEFSGNNVAGDNPYSPGIDRPWTSHYTPSARLFPNTPNNPDNPVVNNAPERYPFNDPFGNSTNKPSAFRTLGDVKNSSEVAALWDATQLRQGGSGARRSFPAWFYSDGTDDSAWHNPNSRFVSTGNVRPEYKPERSVITTNRDLEGDGFSGVAQNRGGIRFRHMNNTRANILYLDGHVGEHSYNKSTGRTSMLAKEFGCNFKKGNYR